MAEWKTRRLCPGRLLRLQLRHLPAAGHGDQRPLLQFDRLERFGGVSLPTGRRVGVEDAGEVGGCNLGLGVLVKFECHEADSHQQGPANSRPLA